MLVELRIKNFAIIDAMSVAFCPGLNIFTGETGAGKSIVIDALALILGDRASNDLIRSSEEEAHVEALFDAGGSKAVEGALKEAGLEYSDSLVIKRVIQRTGRNRIYINHGLATLATLAEAGRLLIDIYGQSEHLSLTRTEEHIEMLDSFAGNEALRRKMSDAYRAWAVLRSEFNALKAESKGIEAKKAFLEDALKELDNAALNPGEEEEIKKSREVLSNAEKLKAASALAESEIYADAGSLTERLGAIVKALKDAMRSDGRLAKAVEPIEAALFGLEDAAAFLRGYAGSIEHDPVALERAVDRLDLIFRLKRKYAGTIEDILSKREAFASELAGIIGIGDRLKGSASRLEDAEKAALDAAGRLSSARSTASKELKKKVEEELKSLGMKGTVFEAAVEEDRGADGALSFGEKGFDRVSFHISTNPGEEVKPLSKIASGGELSRIMLALKKATAAGRVPTLVFDEIDAGVGGRIAETVGAKLKEVSSKQQVICITHLPQIAAFADKHFMVSKKAAQSGRTVSSVAEIEGEAVVDQLSRMLSGSKVTDAARRHAREMLEAARGQSGRGRAAGG